MEELIDYIKNNTNNAYNDIKVVSVLYDKENKNLVLKIVYKSDFNFSAELKSDLINVIKNFIGIQDLNVELKTKKSLLDKTAIYKLISYFMENNYASIYATVCSDDVKIKIIENVVNIDFNIISVFYDYLKNKFAEKELKDFLERNYFQQFNVAFYIKNVSNSFEENLDSHIKNVHDVILQQNNVPEVITYSVNNVKKFIGNEIEPSVVALNCLTKPTANVNLAGEVNFITKRTFKTKRKNLNGEFEEKEFYNFTLSDGYGKVNCVFFPTKENIAKFDELKNNMQIIVNGDLEDYNNKFSLKVKNICFCEMPEKQQETIENKQENSNYVYVLPEPYINLSQSNFFEVQEINTNKFLKENDCVVFDIETTGLEASICEIIEIGACKVKDGKIVETFSSLVKPKALIPAEITELTGITNEMVKDSYAITDVLQDFYKFTRNSVLVAYNISFDYKFIYLAGNAQGYIFDNKQIDCMVLAKTKLKGLKNYKLKTVVAKLNIPLENAHRAVNDAIATAEAFIKLADENM